MKTIVIASDNPVKIQATLNGFQKMFPNQAFEAQSITLSSGISDQPLSDEETYQGALNRVRRAAMLISKADYWVGIEGGIEENEDEMSSFAWVVILSKDLIGKSRTGTFALPKPIADLIRQGKELGEADDIVFNRSNSKRDNGAVGILTDNVIDRIQLYEHAVILALLPFKNPDLFSSGTQVPCDIQNVP